MLSKYINKNKILQQYENYFSILQKYNIWIIESWFFKCLIINKLFSVNRF